MTAAIPDPQSQAVANPDEASQASAAGSLKANAGVSIGTPAASKKAPSPQAGILNRPPEHALVAGLSFIATTPTQAVAALDALRELIRRELNSDIDDLTPGLDKAIPTRETGELGASDGFNRAYLTITVGFSSTGMEVLGIPAAERPADLVPVPWASFGDAPRIAEAGDVVLQLCADDPYVVEHVLRRVEHSLSDQFHTVWTLMGHQRFSSRHGRTSADEGRALIGFHDGLANLDPRHNPGDAELVFVDPAKVANYPKNPPPGPQPPAQPGQPGYGTTSSGPVFPELRTPPVAEPEWTHGGTYMMVRGSVIDTPRWDATPLGQQEHAVGRYKSSGATLDHPDQPDQLNAEPNYAADPNGAVIPFTAHIRKANPRAVSDDAARRIFRRGYPLIAPGPDGQLQRGLVFICFARTTSTQPEFILRAWLRNPNFPVPDAGADQLLAFDTTVLAGGYFFVPPLAHRNRPWTWTLPTPSQ